MKVLQFGQGNFLRTFADVYFETLNQEGLDYQVYVATAIPHENLEAFRRQGNRYHVVLRGSQGGQPVEQVLPVTCLQEVIDPFLEPEAFYALAEDPELKLIVSNTTEAGIQFHSQDSFEGFADITFPAKVTKFLYRRFQAGQPGIYLLPVELIDDNGIALKRCVKTLARLWKLGERFETWLDEACVFTSTLVDRIVTGYPRDEAEAIWQKLGYEDRLLVTGEPFALWVIESEKDISGELPLPDCGLPVIFTDNQKPYKQRKVRILNGAHTSFVPAAFLCGYDYVLDAMNDPMILTFMQKTLYDEVIPTLSLPKEDLMAFAEAVTGRFKNPYIKHGLLSICLNSVSKWRARCMPSLLGYVEREHKMPEHLTFSLAALMALYHGGHLKDGALECLRDGQPYTLRDDAAVLAFFAENNQKPAAELTRMFLSSTDFFGRDLTQVPGLETAVATALKDVLARGMRAVMTERFGG
jgi:tagaturonate reductase